MQVELIAATDDYVLLEVTAPAGTGLPPHVASREDVVVLVLQGELEVTLAGVAQTLRAGQALALPRDVPRTLHAPTALRMLCLAAPADERFVNLVKPPLPDPEDLAVLLTAAGMVRLPSPRA
ncbi:cupin domain-containing protein [Solirubrobacter phytolaccae]|uniref:Cupin domain-containing protein n=1 Tax=Solirubrobacter phytolaccae TaxID=1404360 RepID=A0A9X3SJZ6_9ACTN|nr:cupin domain-containing protein [Solirubrobacter phytolaccae]MDA0185792.1 cupin domain-containing protein [Solirubrobacter phytolaccae]